MSGMDFHSILWPDTPFPLHSSLIIVGRRGSEAHGTFVPTTDENGIDDRDLMGICMPPEHYILGLKHWENAEAIKDVWDVVLYDFRKFVGLLVKQNPNVVGMLYLEEEDYLHVTPVGGLLLEHRKLFRARDAAYASFVGYAYSQLKKMTSGTFNGYMGAKRKALVEKYGYDCKNAGHLIRLLHTGIEYLNDGEFHARRTWDRDMLIEIKTGKWPQDKVQTYATNLFFKIKAAAQSTALPMAVDMEAVNDLVVQCMKAHLRGLTK